MRRFENLSVTDIIVSKPCEDQGRASTKLINMVWNSSLGVRIGCRFPYG